MLCSKVMARLWQQLVVFAHYTLFGFLAFLLELSLLYLYTQNGLPYYYAVPLAFGLSITVQYGFVHWWVFSGSRRPAGFEYLYFIIILLSGMALSTLLVGLISSWFGLGVILARVIAAVFTGTWSFYLNARFNFRAHAFLRQK